MISLGVSGLLRRISQRPVSVSSGKHQLCLPLVLLTTPDENRRRFPASPRRQGLMLALRLRDFVL